MMNAKIFWELINAFSLVMLGFTLCALFLNIKEIKEYKEYSSKIEPKIEMCKNLSLVETANCIRHFINSFYSYKIQPDLNLSTNELIIRGSGDCFDYSNVVLDMSKVLNYKSKEIKMQINNNTAHMFSLIYDKTGYCIFEGVNKPICLIYNDTERDLIK